MKGISYLVNEAGDKTAVILDLRKHRRFWQDMYDRRLIDTRKHEPRESLEQLRKWPECLVSQIPGLPDTIREP